MGEYEDWSVQGHPVASYYFGGKRIVTEQTTPEYYTPDELLIWETLYQTVVDCFKIATKQYKHFHCMRWHHNSDAENILDTAREQTRGWVESDAFTDYVKLLGWEPEIAIPRLRLLLDGAATKEFLKEMEAFIKQIAKERDSRRERS